MNPSIGARQTVDRAKHPTLGEGRLVHRNGPAFFIADSGEWCPLKDVGMGGSRTGPPRYSYKTAIQDGKRIELDETDREHGDMHDRVYAGAHGNGWLVMLGGDRRWWHRFEPDDGKSIEFRVNQMWVGLPEHRDAKSKRAYDSQDLAAKAGWRSMSGDLMTFVWCHEADKEKAMHYLEHRNDPKSRRGKKEAPSGPLPDFANMTREQIKQWQASAR